MKKAYQITAVVIAVLILGGLLIYLLPSKTTGKTIEQAIEKSGRQVEKEIHEEKVKGGETVFFYKSINGGKDYSMAAGYIKKTLWGWEWVYGGEHTHAGPVQPITEQYFPSVKDTPFPLAYGEISDPQIVRVSVQTEKGTTDKETTDKETSIVENGTTRIWYVFLNPSDGPLTKVVGQSQSGSILSSEDISLETSILFERSGRLLYGLTFFVFSGINFMILEGNQGSMWKVNIEANYRGFRKLLSTQIDPSGLTYN